MAIFFYGTLCHLPLLDVVLGRSADTRPARLPGYRVAWSLAGAVPILVADRDAETRGLLLDPVSDQDRARLDFYEGGFGYLLADVTVSTASGPVIAGAYIPDPSFHRPGGPWSLSDWVARYGAIAVEASRDYMALWPDVGPQAATRHYDQMLDRAAARLRAAAEPAPRLLRQGGGAVQVAARRVPYRQFFEIAEWDLRVPSFGGGLGPPVTRAAFVTGDCITVLPYDPARDRVLLVEQFRFGMCARGDPLPWSLEPVAGRIDAGETPEEAARREALEEGGAVLTRLIRIGQHYPSPGVSAEYHFAYIGLADLSDAGQRLGGVEDEAEDIRVLVLSFDALMALIDSGEAQNAPLILSALRLRDLRAALRG